MLQGATNGTIGPQAGDATVVEGVNTAGTVRENSLANTSIRAGGGYVVTGRAQLRSSLARSSCAAA